MNLVGSMGGKAPRSLEDSAFQRIIAKAQFLQRKARRSPPMDLMKRAFSKKRPNVICRGHRACIKVQIDQSTPGFLIAFVETAEPIKQMHD